MILTAAAIEKINTVSNRIALAAEIGCGEQTIINNLKWNKDDGPLTKVSAIKAISKITGLKDSKILEESKITA